MVYLVTDVQSYRSWGEGGIAGDSQLKMMKPRFSRKEKASLGVLDPQLHQQNVSFSCRFISSINTVVCGRGSGGIIQALELATYSYLVFEILGLTHLHQHNCPPGTSAHRESILRYQNMSSNAWHNSLSLGPLINFLCNSP